MSTDTKATAIADGLRALAAMIETHPAVAERMRWTFQRILVPVDARDHVADLARTAARCGAVVTKHQNDKYAGVDIAFGPVSLHVYADRELVCERVVVGTREVTEQVPDPQALAAVPTVTVTRTVEDVQWRCPPLLGEPASQSHVDYLPEDLGAQPQMPSFTRDELTGIAAKAVLAAAGRGAS